MSKIAITIKNDVVDNYADENSAQLQSTKKGWILVDRDPAFEVAERYKWTVRSSDGKLVHVDTNQTSTEEKDSVITNLTLQNLQQVNDITELKKISTAQALQSLQDVQDKEGLQKVITNQTMQILDLQKSITDIKSAAN